MRLDARWPKLAITGPVTAVISGVRYAASCTQVFGTTVLAGARVAPSMQATAMEASSQVCQASHTAFLRLTKIPLHRIPWWDNALQCGSSNPVL